MRNGHVHLRDWTRLGYFCVCLLICFYGCSAGKNLGNQAQTGSLAYLKEEFEKTPPMPNSSVKLPTRTNVKGWHGTVGNDYTSSATADEIKLYYQKELLKNGWSFCRAEKVIYRNQDYGGQHFFYRKGKYTADLQLAGKQESEFGWTYAFSMSWGIFDDVQCA